MRTWTIFTEDTNREGIRRVLDLTVGLEGYTLLYGQGFWVGNGQTYKENSLLIVVLTTDGEMIRDIAREIKKLNNQESVLVTSFKTEMERI